MYWIHDIKTLFSSDYSMGIQYSQSVQGVQHFLRGIYTIIYSLGIIYNYIYAIYTPGVGVAQFGGPACCKMAANGGRNG